MPSSRKLGFALLVIATAQLMLVLDDTIVNVALPSMQRSLHIPPSHLNWAASFYALTFGGLLLAGGRAGDLYGRLRLFRMGLVSSLSRPMAGGLAPNATTPPYRAPRSGMRCGHGSPRTCPPELHEVSLAARNRTAVGRGAGPRAGPPESHGSEVRVPEGASPETHAPEEVHR